MRFRALLAAGCALALLAPGAASAATSAATGAQAASHARARAPSPPGARAGSRRSAPGPANTVHPPYYLALGDSLALGVQPNADGIVLPTDQGYVNDIFAARRRPDMRLRLEDLACPGETTTTMIQGGCPDASVHYPDGSQLAQAVAFMTTHRVAFITLDIGGNDVEPCLASGAVNTACLQTALAAVAANVPQIAAVLRTAAGTGTPIAAMTLYDPFLGDYLDGPAGETFAAESVGVVWALNGELTDGLTAGTLEVADAADAFDTYAPFSETTSVPGLGVVPVSVAQVCALTWMCAPAPQGPDDHPNSAGYSAIAAAFEQVL